MLLAIDVGNTQTVLGLYDGDRLAEHWRLATEAHRTGDEFGALIGRLLDLGSISGICLSSTVPRLVRAYEELAERWAHVPILVVGPGIRTGITMRSDSPREVGPDRIEISMEALFARAARLVKIDFEEPPSVIGKSTETALRSGLVYGFSGQVDGIVDRIRGELATDLRDTVRIHASSGTRGKPTIVAYTAADVRLFADVNARAIACAGGTAADVLHVAYGYGLFTGGLGLHYGGERLGATVVPASGGNPGFQVQMMADLGAAGLACTPSFAMVLAERAAADGLLDRFRLRYGLHGAEPWSEAFRQKLE